MNELLAFLGKVLDDTKYALYLDIAQGLQAYQYIDHEHEILDLLNSSEEGEMVKILDEVNTILDVAMNVVLSAHGVFCEATLYDKSTLLNALYRLTNWTEREYLYAITNQEVSPTEKLAELLAHVSDRDVTFYLEHLTSVSNSLINRIRELYQPVDEVADEINLQRLAIVREFTAKHRDTWAEELLVERGIPFESPLELIISLTPELANIRELSDEDAACQIIALFLISDVQISTLMISIKEHLDGLYPNVNDFSKLTSVYSQIQMLLMQEGIHG